MMYAVPVGTAFIGALAGMVLVPRWSLLRAVLLVPAAAMVVAIALCLFVLVQTRPGGGDMRDPAVVVILMIASESAVASLATGLLAGGLRLRYLRRR